jgi:hypothetical protein
MPTYYHGTISVFQESILKKGLLRTSGHPNIDFDGKRYVWLSPDIIVAAEYAEMRTTCLAAPIGGKVRLMGYSNYSGVIPLHSLRGVALYNGEKLAGSVAPSARAIVFAIYLPDSWKEVAPSPTIPGEWRSARSIPPSMLTLVDLGTLKNRRRDVEAAMEILLASSDISLLTGWCR